MGHQHLAKVKAAKQAGKTQKKAVLFCIPMNEALKLNEFACDAHTKCMNENLHGCCNTGEAGSDASSAAVSVAKKGNTEKARAVWHKGVTLYVPHAAPAAAAAVQWATHENATQNGAVPPKMLPLCE